MKPLSLVVVVLAVGTLVPAAPAESADSAATQLHALFDQEWEYTLRQNPTFASRLGDRRYNHRWPDRSLAAIERRHQHDQEVLRKLDAIDPAALSPADRFDIRAFHNLVLGSGALPLDLLEANLSAWIHQKLGEN